MTASSIAVAPKAKAQPQGPQIIAAALIVIGRDDAGKSHASWFDADEAELATKAADLMGMQALPVTSDALRLAAAGLPHGRVFASGKAFVPFVKAATFEALAMHLPEGTTVAQPKPEALTLVKGAKAEKKPAEAAAEGNAGEVGGEAADSGSGAEGEAFTFAADWSALVVGCLVLASEGEGHGWYETVIVEAHDDDLFTLRWRDWPDMETFVRRRPQIALLHPDFEQA